MAMLSRTISGRARHRISVIAAHATRQRAAGPAPRAASTSGGAAALAGGGGPMAIDFGGRRALVTGAGKGIGRDTAKLLAACNAEVVALSRTEADLASLKAEIGCETLCVDLEDALATKAALEALVAEKPVELLVNNAAISRNKPFFEVTLEDFESCFNVNVRSILVVSQVVAKAMPSGAAIVNVSSQSSFRALDDHTIYCATKGALDQMTRVMALELGPLGIRVNSVHPTVVMTPMGRKAWGDPEKSGPMLARIPLGRFAETEDCAQAIAYLLSEQASMLHGVMMPIEGGFLVT